MHGPPRTVWRLGCPARSTAWSAAGCRYSWPPTAAANWRWDWHSLSLLIPSSAAKASSSVRQGAVAARLLLLQRLLRGLALALRRQPGARWHHCLDRHINPHQPLMHNGSHHLQGEGQMNYEIFSQQQKQRQSQTPAEALLGSKAYLQAVAVA
jgi:hypothetical protein